MKEIKTPSYQSFHAKTNSGRRQNLQRPVQQQRAVVEVREAASQERLEEKAAFAFAEVLKTNTNYTVVT